MTHRGQRMRTIQFGRVMGAISGGCTARDCKLKRACKYPPELAWMMQEREMEKSPQFSRIKWQLE